MSKDAYLSMLFLSKATAASSDLLPDGFPAEAPEGPPGWDEQPHTRVAAAMKRRGRTFTGRSIESIRAAATAKGHLTSLDRASLTARAE